MPFHARISDLVAIMNSVLKDFDLCLFDRSLPQKLYFPTLKIIYIKQNSLKDNEM